MAGPIMSAGRSGNGEQADRARRRAASLPSGSQRGSHGFGRNDAEHACFGQAA